MFKDKIITKETKSGTKKSGCYGNKMWSATRMDKAVRNNTNKTIRKPSKG